jgi:hypothetical protein
MPHIALTSTEPGIRGLLRYRPQTARPLGELTECCCAGRAPWPGASGN